MRRRQLITASAIAAFLVFHLTGIIIKALPSPEPALDRSQWKDPGVQRELDAWARRLAIFGVHWTGTQFAEHGIVLVEHYLHLRNAVLHPFDKYFDWCGTTQAWSMFQAPHRHPARLRIDVQEHGAWRTVFRERDDRYTWMEPILSDTRFRSIIFRLGWPPYRHQLEIFSNWIADRAAHEFPQADQARVVLERAESVSPEAARRGERPQPTDDPALAHELKAFR